jgi:hypothetical protein
LSSYGKPLVFYDGLWKTSLNYDINYIELFIVWNDYVWQYKNWIDLRLRWKLYLFLYNIWFFVSFVCLSNIAYIRKHTLQSPLIGFHWITRLILNRSKPNRLQSTSTHRMNILSSEHFSLRLRLPMENLWFSTTDFEKLHCIMI